MKRLIAVVFLAVSLFVLSACQTYTFTARQWNSYAKNNVYEAGDWINVQRSYAWQCQAYHNIPASDFYNGRCNNVPAKRTDGRWARVRGV